ncbi:MAG TPA: aminoacyl-tRNA hydrolase [Bacteroidota bacterium]|nr:aminoacyl-tRNA hydrolase [Bacteroidota bacterium]
MHCIVGLGNPGQEYQHTRHNIGFDILDGIAERLKIPFKPGKGEYEIGFGSFKNCEMVLLKPLTYMNNSGEAILDIGDRYDIPLERFLVLCDDFQLPLGRLRLRPEGSDGGHNGLYSIIYHLKSTSFPRLRCGIASEHLPVDRRLMTRYVLEPFDPEERPAVRSMILRASEASLSFVTEGIQKTMDSFNQSLSSNRKDS